MSNFTMTQHLMQADPATPPAELARKRAALGGGYEYGGEFERGTLEQVEEALPILYQWWALRRALVAMEDGRNLHCEDCNCIGCDMAGKLYGIIGHFADLLSTELHSSQQQAFAARMAELLGEAPVGDE